MGTKFRFSIKRNEIQKQKEFVKELGYCVDYLNFTTVDKDANRNVSRSGSIRVWLGYVKIYKKANNLFGIRVFKSTAHLLH